MTVPKIFISHRWANNDFYVDLVHHFKEQEFLVLDYSCPKDKPLEESKFRKIASEIENRIRKSDVFLVFVHHEMKNSFWCQYEIYLAKRLKKPRLGIIPKGHEVGDEGKAALFDLLLTIPNLIADREFDFNTVSLSLVIKIRILMFVNSIKWPSL